MTNPSSSDHEFEEYMHGNSPLSEVYQQTSCDGPSDKTDQFILQAARDEVSRPNKHSASSRGFQWYVPLALAASVLIAVGIIRFYPDNEDTTVQTANTNPNEPGTELSAASKSSPQIMLEHISALIKESEIQKAKEEYALFRELFPDYEIDYAQYPELNKLAK